MKASNSIGLMVLIAASLVAVLPARGGELLHHGRRAAQCNTGGFAQGSGDSAQGNMGYYDPAWGMPLAVVVPPTVRWQSNYAWGVGGSRLTRVGAQYQPEFPGPESAYNQRGYLPAPPQPSDTEQFGVYYARGPRR